MFIVNVLFWALVIVAVSVFVLLWMGILCIRVVKEGTAVAFLYTGRFAYMAMEFRDRHFDEKGDVVRGPGPNGYGSCWCIWRAGGWVLYLHPLVRPAQYEEFNERDGFGGGIYIRLGDLTPEPFISQAETAEPENAPLNVKFVDVMRVINPYNWIFSSPKNVNAEVVRRQDSVLRAWVRSGDKDHAQSAKGDGAKLWSEIVALNCMTVFDTIRRDWGLEIVPNSIIVEDVGFDPDYQAAMKARSQETLLAQAKIAKITAVDTAMTSWVNNQATLMGKPVSEALAVLKADGSWLRQHNSYMAQIMVDGNADLLLIGNPDGSAMDPNLATVASFATLFGGRIGGNRRGGRDKRDNRGGKGSNAGGDNDEPDDEDGKRKPVSEEPYRVAAKKFFDTHGVYPSWDPDHRTPVGDGKPKPKKA